MRARLAERFVLGAALVAAFFGCKGLGWLIGTFVLGRYALSADQSIAVGIVAAIGIAASVYIFTARRA